MEFLKKNDLKFLEEAKDNRRIELAYIASRYLEYSEKVARSALNLAKDFVGRLLL